MSTVAIHLIAEDCNAWASDLVLGMPSPLSVSLYLRALFCECGLRSYTCFMFGLRDARYDKGRRSARPLLTYQASIDDQKPAPLFDEDRFDLDVSLVVATSARLEAAALQRAVRFMPFLGGNVRHAEVYAVDLGSDRGLARPMRDCLIYIDETEHVFARVDEFIKRHWYKEAIRTDCASALTGARPPDRGKLAMIATALANLDHNEIQQSDLLKFLQQQCGFAGDDGDHTKFADLLRLFDGYVYRIMPLGYRRLTEFVARPDARPIKAANRLEGSMHAFVEAAHGFVRLLGPRRALSTSSQHKIWWAPRAASSMDDLIVYQVKGECL